MKTFFLIFKGKFVSIEMFEFMIILFYFSCEFKKTKSKQNKCKERSSPVWLNRLGDFAPDAEVQETDSHFNLFFL